MRLCLQRNLRRNLSSLPTRSLVLLVSLLLLASTTACEVKAPAADPVADPVATAEAARPTAAGDDKRYDVVFPTDTLQQGAVRELAMVVKPGRGFKINKEFPWKAELDAPTNATLGAASVGKEAMKLEDAQASIPLTVTAASPGPVEVRGKVSFSVCNDDRCEILRDQPIAFTLTAEEGAAAAEAAPEAAPEAANKAAEVE